MDHLRPGGAMSVAERIEIIPTKRDANGALRAMSRLAQAERTGTKSVRLPEVELSESVYDVVVALLRALSLGHSVAVVEKSEIDLDEEVSTGDGAQILGVSRPKFVDILEAGLIPYRMVGTHRRARRGDVLAYRETMKRGPGREALRRAQVESLKRQARISNEAGAGY
jgi:excisionase family DNA binding protein